MLMNKNTINSLCYIALYQSIIFRPIGGSCTEKQYQCPVEDPPVCLSPQRLCDGKQDCQDAQSDEDSGTCAYFYKPFCSKTGRNNSLPKLPLKFD